MLFVVVSSSCCLLLFVDDDEDDDDDADAGVVKTPYERHACELPTVQCQQALSTVLCQEDT